MTDGFLEDADGCSNGIGGDALFEAAFVARVQHLVVDDLEIVAQRLKIRRRCPADRRIGGQGRDGNGRQQDKDEAKGAAPDRTSHGARVAVFMGNLTSASLARLNLDDVKVEALAWLITTATCAKP